MFYDEDNVAYETREKHLVDMVHKMDQEENYGRVMRFLERYSS